MNLTKVTVTGADDSIKPEALFELSRKFPFAEWGILIGQSATDAGCLRFPSWDWLRRLIRLAEAQPLPISAHVCGRWVRSICANNWSHLEYSRGELLSVARRIQLNFHGLRHEFQASSLERLTGTRFTGKQFIFQLDGINDPWLRVAREFGVNGVGLHDCSHGAGIMPESWPAPLYPLVGYSGGLSPENVAEQLKLIEQVAPEAPIWIDAETRVRSNNDKQFDLQRVEAFLAAAAPFAVPF